MLKKVLLVLFFVLGIGIAVNAQYLQVGFNTTTIDGGEYSPRHILAVWVEDSNGNFVNSLVVYADERKSKLGKWYASSGGYKTDAITGATLSNNDKHHLIEWDLKDYAGQTVQNGTYTLCMEITSNDFAGPYREIEIELDGNDFTLDPDDGANFANISILFENEATFASTFDYNKKYLKIYPNPVNDEMIIELLSEKESQASFRMLNANGEIVRVMNVSVNRGNNEINASDLVHNVPPGNYALTVETDHYKVARKILVN